MVSTYGGCCCMGCMCKRILWIVCEEFMLYTVCVCVYRVDIIWCICRLDGVSYVSEWLMCMCVCVTGSCCPVYVFAELILFSTCV